MYLDQYRLFMELLYCFQHGKSLIFSAVGHAKPSLHRFVSRTKDLLIQPPLEVYIPLKDELRMEFSPSHNSEYYRALENFIKESYEHDNSTLDILFSVQRVSKLKKDVSDLLSQFDTPQIPITQPVYDQITQKVKCDLEHESPLTDSNREAIALRPAEVEFSSIPSSDLPIVSQATVLVPHQ